MNDLAGQGNDPQPEAAPEQAPRSASALKDLRRNEMRLHKEALAAGAPAVPKGYYWHKMDDGSFSLWRDLGGDGPDLKTRYVGLLEDGQWEPIAGETFKPRTTDGRHLTAEKQETAPKSDQSLSPEQPPKVTSHSESKVTSHFPRKVLDFQADRQKVTSHSGDGKWKKSRLKPGYLIKRIPGYDIVESEYGVSYLYVTSRTPTKKTTSGDFALYEHAGFSTWRALEASGRLVKGDRSERLDRDRTRAS